MSDTTPGPADVYRAYIAAEAAGDKGAMAALLAPGINIEMNGRPAFESAAEDAAAVTVLFDAYPDYRRELIEIIEQGDVAAARWHMVGTPRAEFADRLGELDIAGCSIVKVRDGRMVDAYVWSPDGVLEEIVAMVTADAAQKGAPR